MKEGSGGCVVRPLLRYFCNLGGCSIGKSQEKPGPGKELIGKSCQAVYRVWRRATDGKKECQEALER